MGDRITFRLNGTMTPGAYPDAQRGFFNEARPEMYDAAAADDAWTKTLAFFRRELGA